MKIIAVDYDGVIHKYSKGWHDGTLYDEPMDGAKEMITKLKSQGFKIIVHTTRTNFKEIEEWLDKYNILVDEVTNIKPIAKWYIDDRGIRFTNWNDIVKYFI